MRGMQRIVVGTQGIGKGMQEIGVGMKLNEGENAGNMGNGVGMQGI